MSFLSPLFLASLPLLAVPVVIHLLSRRQRKRISWGAMRFLVMAATRKRRIWRLTDLLLLLLRTAAFLLLILALARPLVPATWLGGAVPREVILVLDPSMSMSRQAAGITLFEAQVQQANGVLDELTGSDTIRLLLAGESPEWLSPEALPATGSTLRKLRQQLNELQPTLGAADLISAIREVVDLEAPKDKAARIIYVISDGQRFGWRLDESPLWSAVESRIKASSIPTAVNLQWVNASGASENACVSSLASPRAVGALGQPLSFTATVQNHGTHPSEATLLNWQIGDQSIGVTSVPQLAPGAGTRLSLAHTFDATGTFDVGCTLEATDALTADDQGHLLVEIFDRLPILLIENPASPQDAPFILAALGAPTPGLPNPDWRSVFEPEVVDPGAAADLDFSPFACIVLSDAEAASPELVRKLEHYARAGGGVWIALDAQTDPALFNEHFHRGGVGLAPLKLTTPIGDPDDQESFIPMRASSDSHPATALLADFQRLDLDRVRIYRRHQFDPFSGQDVSVLLQTPGGEPVAVEQRFARGRVIVQAIPLGVSWSTLPLSQAYVAMLHEWLWYLSEPNLSKRNLTVGEALIEMAPNPRAQAELSLPDARTVEVTATRSASLDQFRYLGTRLPGLYTLSQSDPDQPTLLSKFYVQRNPEESNLAAVSDEDRETLAGTAGFSLDAGLDSLETAGEIKVPKHPLAGWLLTALAMVLLSELALASWTTHQRRLRVQPVTL